jgi:VTC domain
VAVAFAEGRITKLRRETKLLLSAAEAAALRARLSTEVGAPIVSRVVSVYFDGQGWPLAARAAVAPHDTVKVRFKEYFPDRGKSGEGRVVLELKREANGVTRKERVWVPRRELESALREPAVPAFRAVLGDRALLPAVAVSYEREIYQSDESWRVTVDSCVEFFRIDARLAVSTEPLRRELLGEPAGCEERTIVEVKHVENGVPAWLAVWPGSPGYSKFAQAMRCVHGVGEPQAAVG